MTRQRQDKTKYVGGDKGYFTCTTGLRCAIQRSVADSLYLFYPIFNFGFSDLGKNL